MTRSEAVAILKGFMDNPLFSDIHKAAFNIAIHDIEAYHKWNLNELVLRHKDVEEVPTGKYEYHTDHTDCIWYGNDSGCPVTCSQYRDG